jgi:hydrogenase nickel incorporation protein HypA/HybF
MHELAITRSLLDLVLEEAAKANASKVLKINVVLGEMSGVVDRFVEFNFDLLSKDTAAASAELSFRNVPKQARCHKCSHVFNPEEIRWACPNCQSTELEIIAGNELYVESIEVE